MKLQPKVKYRFQLGILRSRKVHRITEFLIILCIVCVLSIFLSSFLRSIEHQNTQSHRHTFILNAISFRKFQYGSKEEYPVYLKPSIEGSSLSNGNYESESTIKVLNNTEFNKKENSSKFNKTELFFKDDFVIEDPFLKHWKEKKTVLCDGKFQGYANMFARWVNITIDASKSRGARGGEDISQVLKQRESAELLNPKMGFFAAECTRRPEYKFVGYMKSRGHLPAWLKVVKYSPPARIHTHPQIDVISNFTMIFPRNEYANLYHSMNDLFNVFLLHVFFHKDPKNSVIIFADGHPKGHIDAVWEKLFGRVIRARHLQKPKMFKELVWAMMEKFSPFNLLDLKQVSYIDHFRTFVFREYGLVPRKSPDCENINVLFIWRHDYLAHPRNPKGKIMRKIKNEDEIFNYTKTSFPGVKFRSADLAPLDMKEQLNLISKSDIIIAMHGAGLTLELFLPPMGGVIELLPIKRKSFTERQSNLFKVITDRIPLHYIRWQNKDKSNEVSVDYTIIPPYIVKTLLKQMFSKLCPNE